MFFFYPPQVNMLAALTNWIPLVYLDTPASESQDSQWNMRPQSPPKYITMFESENPHFL